MDSNDKKITITIHLADMKPLQLSIDAEAEVECRRSEELVNTLWNRWMAKFKDAGSSQEVMARVAFQFARLYVKTYNTNAETNKFLSEFEKQLDELVVRT